MVYSDLASRQLTMPQIRDDPMEPSILIRSQTKNEGFLQNRVKGKFVGWDRLRKVVSRGRLVGEFAHDDFIYIRR